MSESEFIPGVETEANASTGEIRVDDSCLSTLSPLIKDPNFDKQPVSRTEIMDYGDECFLLKPVLTPQECHHFIEEGERIEFSVLNASRDDYRSCKRISFQSPELANILWHRIKEWLKPIVIEGDPREQHIEGPQFLMQGSWEPTGLNDVFRLCRYLPGGHFAPHNDGYFVKSSRERSLQTFMLYLNEDFSRGSTNFVDPAQTLYKDSDGKYCAEEKNILCRIKPATGMAIIFNHNRLHEGEKLGDGKKYILRTDIMFENTTPTSLSNNQDKAMQMLQDADRLESQGQCMEAMELYRKAFKLSPELADSYSPS